MFFAKKKDNNEPIKVPKHIAIIMDGNGRWAKNRGLPRSFGHSAGAKKFKEIARYCNKIGVEYLTVYAFSTENWRRPKEEVDGIMDLLREYLKDSTNFKDENVKLRFVGDRTGLSDDIVALMEKAERDSDCANGMTAVLAVNYGGRHELLHVMKQLAKDGVKPEDITEDAVNERLYTAAYPDPDLIIRPSGEYRLSNFLTWQSAYSEFWFTPVLWPDYNKETMIEAIRAYSKRDRRFGGV